MIKVALIGAPGADKSVVARRLARKLNGAANRNFHDWKVIDSYTDRFIKCSHDVGVYASYQVQMELVCWRWMLEDEAEMHGYHTITCGSIYESMVYTSIRGAFVYPEENLRLADAMLCQGAMTFMGGIETLMFDYDALFYLPLDKGVAEDHSWEAVVNAKIPEAMEALGKVCVTLTGTLNQKIKHAFEIVGTIRDAVADSQASPPE